MPIEQQTDEFYNALLERCLKEGKPASHFITIEENPEVIVLKNRKALSARDGALLTRQKL